MRRLAFIVTFLSVLYSAYWFVGQRAVVAGSNAAISQARSDGWQVEYADMYTRGFPSRFDTTLEDVSFGAPNQSWTWSGPLLRIFALSYQPNKVIVALPSSQQLEIAGQTLDIATQSAKASAAVVPGIDLAFDTATVEIDEVYVESNAGWVLKLDHMLSATRRQDESVSSYDIYSTIDQIMVPSALAQQIDPTSLLGPHINWIEFDGAVKLDQVLDRRLVTVPMLEQMTINDAKLRWGAVTITAKGMIDIDPSGVPEGRLVFQSAQWQEMIEIMVAAGLVDPDAAPTVMRMAGLMASNGVLSLPLVFQDGAMTLGPLPIGPAPRFR